jgi:hypothetical protein
MYNNINIRIVGKPSKRKGRKAMGLKIYIYDSQVAYYKQSGYFYFIGRGRRIW